MKRPITQQYNLIKHFGFVLLFGFISLGAIGGCSNGGGDNNNTQALTENDFVEDSSLSARPDGGVVVHFLEPPGGQTAENDTGGVGDDVIPLRYNRMVEHTICWEDDDEAAAHFMILVDSEGQEVLSVEANGDCVTKIIDRGSYEMHLHHDGLSGDTHPVFIQSINESSEAKNSSGEYDIFKTAKRLIEGTLQSFGITTEARAQTVAQNREMLIQTKTCIGCNLEKANLFLVDLTGANLTNANLNMANMNASTLTNSTLAGATLTDATLIGSVMMGADLSSANLTGASLLRAFMMEADLTGADLTGATLPNADMTGANLVMTNLTDANLMQVNLTDGILTDATLAGADLTEAKLNTATLSTATLDGAKLFEADLTGANLTGANITQVNLNASTLTNSNLTDANLTDATLIGSILMGANLTGANLTRANFLGADLIDVNLTDTFLSFTTFDNARWCDGSCTCGTGSVDMCAGCAAIASCTGS